MKSRKQPQIGNTKLVERINHLSKLSQTTLKIEDLHEKTMGTDPFVFELTIKLFENLQNIHFGHEFEEKTMTMTHDTLFGFVYSLVQQIFEEMGKLIDPKRVEDLVNFNLTNFFLFFQPVNITEEEDRWVQDHIIKTKDKSDGVVLNVPLNNKKYYFINLKRILDKNRDNPDFNDSILDFMFPDL
jgi:hypothetical protein